MSNKLSGKTAFITGGNSGIGLATAKEFRNNGAKVIILARTKDKGERAITEIGGNASFVVGDVSDLASLAAAYEVIKSEHGNIDVLLSAAGIANMTGLGTTDAQQFDTLVDVNFKGAFFTVQLALPILNQGASVVLLSSCLNEMGMEGFSVYNATKAAIRSLARSLTPDLAKIGGRINVLSPGPIRTPALENAGLSVEEAEAQYQVFNKTLASGRTGEPREMAKASLFLACDDSSFMYGSDLQADGGMNQVRWPASL